MTSKSFGISQCWAVFRNMTRTLTVFTSVLRVHKHSSQKRKEKRFWYTITIVKKWKNWFWYITTVLKKVKKIIQIVKPVLWVFEITRTGHYLVMDFFPPEKTKTDSPLKQKYFKNQNWASLSISKYPPDTGIYQQLAIPLLWWSMLWKRLLDAISMPSTKLHKQ
jgi:hypothetical protein